MSKTTPEEAKRLAQKYGVFETLHYGEDGKFPRFYAAIAKIIDEIRGVDADPVATVKRGGVESFGYATMFVKWEAGSEKLPLGTHQLYASPTPSQPAAPDTISITHQIATKTNAGVILFGLADSLLTIANEFPESLDEQTFDAIEAVLALRTKTAPVELPVVAKVFQKPRILEAHIPIIEPLVPWDQLPLGTELVKLSDAQAAIAAGRKTS